MKLKQVIKKRQFQFGDCIPESLKVYQYFRKKGYNAEMVEGWVEVNDGYNLEPDNTFLYFFFPEIYLKVNEDSYYLDYPKVLKHTWVEVNNHIIDITKNQFDIYDGIKKYYKWETYYFKEQKEIIAYQTMPQKI